jgi:hypothetical protein
MQVSGTDDVKGGMQAVLDCFHDWLEAGAGGASNWSVEPENHEGWRVSIDEGPLQHVLASPMLQDLLCAAACTVLSL